MKTGDNIVLLLEIPKGIKRSWKWFKNIMKNNDELSVDLDLRKSSKTYTPLHLTVDCCKSEISIKREKDFPLKNKKCKCGKFYIVKWNTV